MGVVENERNDNDMDGSVYEVDDSVDIADLYVQEVKK